MFLEPSTASGPSSLLRKDRVSGVFLVKCQLMSNWHVMPDLIRHLGISGCYVGIPGRSPEWRNRISPPLTRNKVSSYFSNLRTCFRSNAKCAGTVRMHGGGFWKKKGLEMCQIEPSPLTQRAFVNCQKIIALITTNKSDWCQNVFNFTSKCAILNTDSWCVGSSVRRWWLWRCLNNFHFLWQLLLVFSLSFYF